MANGNPLQTMAFFALFVLVCFCIAAMARRWLKPHDADKLAAAQLKEAERFELEHQAAAEQHAAMALMYRDRIARLEDRKGPAMPMVRYPLDAHAAAAVPVVPPGFWDKPKGLHPTILKLWRENRKVLETDTGAELDKWGEALQVTRLPGQTDDDYRLSLLHAHDRKENE